MTTRHEAQVDEPPRQRTQQETEQVPTRGDITYLEAGAGVPVLFLHGIGGAARMWAPQLDAFAAAGYRALAWDMPGHGGSAPLALVTMDALAASLGGFIAELELDRPVLVGHSMGGMLILRLLARAPHAARAVVLSQTTAAFGSKDPAWAKQFVHERLAPLDAGHNMADLASQMVASMVGDEPDPAGTTLARIGIAATLNSTFRDTVLALPGFDERGTLSSIIVPTLVLAGSRDTNAPAPGMERMAARIADARYVCIEGSGHLVHLEQPRAFNAAVLDFLAAVPA